MFDDFSAAIIKEIPDKSGNPIVLQRALHINGYKLNLVGGCSINNSQVNISVDADYMHSSGNLGVELRFTITNFGKETPIIEINSLRSRQQNRGSGSLVLSKLLELVDSLGVENLKVSASEIGGYYWARAGFVPQEEAWPKLQAQIDERLATHEKKSCKDVLKREGLSKFAKDNSSNILIETDWIGYLDLSNPKQRGHLEEYLDSKKEQGLAK